MFDEVASTVEIEFGNINTRDVKKYNSENFFIDTGSPHHVTFVDNLRDFDVISRGHEICHSKRYQKIGGTNVNFIQVKDDGELSIRTYDRGVGGEIMACGTGAVGSVVVNTLHQYANDVKQPHKKQVTVLARSGNLMVMFHRAASGDFTKLRLVGPVRLVYSGVFPIGKEFLTS